ncbi:hypothetical protein T4D_10006 [Trichinella pseudospiralis]|uniref:Uncharacterized protein n=1 Tax=Trichinella pseudospiralis TaxID=6337 RepID=A0A0V1G2R0_TRIPS|nr:hypothetical protein T4D_10006 [Trichinella pseudospiralis]
MDPTEWVMKVEDFCASGVPASNYGIVGRYLLRDPVSSTRMDKRGTAFLRRQSIQQYAQEIAELERRAGVSERYLVARFVCRITSREVYRAIRLQEQPTLAEARKLAIRIIQMEENFQERQQQRAGIMKPENIEAAQRIEALI